jgi:hypothetical protein
MTPFTKTALYFALAGVEGWRQASQEVAKSIVAAL